MRALGLIILIFCPLIATAQDGTAVRTVSVAKLIDDSIPGQKLQNELRAEAKKVEALQKRLAAELQSLEKELQQSGSALSTSARERKLEAFTEKRKASLRQIEDEREKLAIKERDGLARVVRELREHIKAYGTANNLEVIIEDDPRVVAYKSNRLDITSGVLAFVNEETIGVTR